MNDKQPVSVGVISPGSPGNPGFSPGSLAEAFQFLAKEKKHEQTVAKAIARLLKMAVVTEIGGVVSVSELMEDEIEGPTFGIETSQGQRLFVTVSAA